jgi:putative hydrolase of the HAD superfamily
VLRAVLFDWGDTLTTIDWRDGLPDEGNAAGLAAIGRDGLPDPAEITRWFSRTDELFPLDAEDEADLMAIHRECLSSLGLALAEHELRRYVEASHAYWGRFGRVHEATLPLLDALRERGLLLAIVSNTPQPAWLLEPLLELQGLVARVDAVVLSSEVGKRKPHAAIFERALAELGIAAEEALFVGDRLYHDVLGAARVGMRTVQARWFRVDEHPLGAEPDFRADRPGDVLDLVGGLLAAARD